MLTQVDVNSENAFVVPIVGSTPRDSLFVRKITGLDPPKLDLFIGDYASDGGTFQGRRAQKRNVVLTFDLNPNPALGESVSGLRDLLYKAFLDPAVDADYIQLNLHDDEGRIRYVVGYTETFEADIFSSDTSTQISLICPDPYIRDASRTTLLNPGGWMSTTFTYPGTADAGLEIEIFPQYESSLMTFDINGKKMILTDPPSSGVIYINTNNDARAVLTASATDVSAWKTDPDNAGRSMSDCWNEITTTSLLAKLTASSPWIQLHSQSNLLKVYGETEGDGAFTAKTIEFRTAYWGV